MAVYAAQLGSKVPFAPTAQVPVHAPPPGTFLPGTKVQVGSHRVIIERYLSEGGFAHVYVVRMPTPVDGTDKAVLKRVAVPDKDQLASMRTEVETMKRLRGNKYIVKYMDSHASPLKAGGYEVFLLMEFCSSGGLIDFMNTRLQNRLTEPEIVKIFTDVAEGVAAMHYLHPPLLHRDLKIENVLITTVNGSRLYKLCDFGSAAQSRPAATSAAEGRLIEEDVQRHTTLQYRSPEMIDVYRKQPIDEKSDIWALGVFLYKLCYYTTPFEEAGQMAILNASFKFPGYPRFSDDLKLLIATMLRENPAKRPNIYQVLQKSCHMDKRELQWKDIYLKRSQSQGRKHQTLPEPSSSKPRLGATLSAPKEEAPVVVPDITPMRRGRPTKPVSHHTSAKPSPSPLRVVNGSDAFASLDGGKAGVVDDFSSRFPSLHQFDLLTNKSSKYAFEPQNEKVADIPDDESHLRERVTAALADDAFARPMKPAKSTPDPEIAGVGRAQTLRERKKPINLQESRSRNPPPQIAPKPNMISASQMTAEPTSLPGLKPVSDRPIWRVHSAESRQIDETAEDRRERKREDISRQGPSLADLLKSDAAGSQLDQEQNPRSPTSSRPSLEGGRPSMQGLGLGTHRSRSLNMRTRPASVNIGAGPTHIKDRVIARSDYVNAQSQDTEMPSLTAVESETNIASDIDFLKAKEEEDKSRRHHLKRLSSGSRHGKRQSLPSLAVSGTKTILNGPSMALSGTKSMLTGRFGDAFKVFEGHHEHGHRKRGSSPLVQPVMSPIAGSVATDLSEDQLTLAETEDLSPELRREIEKRKLEAEERRVEMAAAEFRQRLAERGGRGGGTAKAASIQHKVSSLLKENESPVKKTATGYGKFTDTQTTDENPLPQRLPTTHSMSNIPDAHTLSAPASTVGLPTRAAQVRRPMAPPKPTTLKTGREQAQPTPAAPTGNEQLVTPDDWESTFNKRYPSLSGIEQVETDIGSSQPSARTVKEV